jgi:Flp pilus assembly protein TadD
MGNSEKALDSFDEALKLKPDFTDAMIAKGVILGKLGRKDEAKLCAERILDLKGQTEEEKAAQNNSVNNSIKQEYQAAQKRLRESFASNP